MALKRITDKARFFAKCYVLDNGCWEWRARLSHNGYGRFFIGSRTDKSRREVPAHRFSYQIYNGIIPRGLEIDHLCRKPNCVNPEHLEAVTKRENLIRGTGFIAINAAKTHCKHGHEFIPENIYWVGTSRSCKICRALEVSRRWNNYKSNRLKQRHNIEVQ